MKFEMTGVNDLKKALNNLSTPEFITQQVLKQGITVNCPKCNHKFKTNKISSHCPNCNEIIKIKFE